VACRQLGFPKGAIKITNGSYFGTVPDEFSYTSLICNGYETDFHLCYNNDLPADCDGNNGAGVICNTESPPAGNLSKKLQKNSELDFIIKYLFQETLA
jgi:hypothetical protein